MSGFDLHNNIDNKIAFPFSSLSAPFETPGEIIDTLGFESIEFIGMSSTLFLSGLFSIILEQGDDAGLSDAVAVSADEILGDLPELSQGDDDVTIRVGSIGKKRFQRMSVIGTGDIFGNFCAIVILGHPHTAPVAQ